jgi:hypothetical protein
VFIYIPASAAVTVWRRRTIDDVLTDGEERLLQHISQQLTREMHVARSHHSHVSVITVGGGRDVLGGRSPVHIRHPKPTRHHEGYASGPMLDGVLATGLHSALHGKALQHIRNPHSIVLRAAESRRGRLSVDDTLALAARAVGPARLALLLRPKGDAKLGDALDAATLDCGWRRGCAGGPTGRLRDRPRRRGTAVAAPPLLRVAIAVLSGLSRARLRGGARNLR